MKGLQRMMTLTALTVWVLAGTVAGTVVVELRRGHLIAAALFAGCAVMAFGIVLLFTRFLADEDWA
jgi:hypothetical protein